MTINAEAAFQQPLRTEREKVTRIRDLLAPASIDGRLWALVLDGDGRQTPLMIPIEDCPEIPDPAILDGLGEALITLMDDNVDGSGQVLFVVERLGPFGPTHEDRCWAAALTGACARADLRLAGTFLLSPGGVSPLGT